MSEFYEQANGGPEGDEKGNLVYNQPYDERVEVSDGEEIASTNATPRGMDQQQEPNGTYRYNTQPLQQHDTVLQQQPQPLTSQQQPVVGVSGGGVATGGGGGMQYLDEDDDSPEEQSESEESDELEEGPHATLSGAYDPNEFEHLQVSSELKELFQHITRYTPQTVELETKLRPFIPEYVPAIGDIDAFLKVTRPDGKSESLGLSVLDEPRAKQSDPTVLDLQLRALTKQSTVKPMTVHNIADPEKQSKALSNWIESISELHRQKPATNVHYTKNMPDIENLMQEWHPKFEEVLNEVGLPSADLDCDLSQYADIICSLLDIPVYKSRVHSLHVLFSLYMEFKNSQHFRSLAAEEPVVENQRSDSVIPEV